MIGKSTTARSIVLTLFVMGMTSCGPDEDLGRQEVSYQEVNRQLTCLSDHAKSLLSGEKLLRPDGYAYTVDLAQLLILAARRDDKKGYRALSDRLLGSVYISGDKDPQAKGFVAWRYQKGAPLDASGTTEMLRLAQGLWEGGDAAHRSIALTIAAGYMRHQTVDQGIWIIRNYYNLQTKAFATNSYLVDYDPDLLAALAGASGDQVLADGARRSYEVVLRAMSPAGLIHTVIQPELATLTDKKLAFFSPNDVVKLANACTVAERSLGEARRAGQELLKLVLARLPDVREYYLGASGEPVPGAKAAGPAARACLVRLAANMKDRGALDRLWPVLLAKLPDCCTAAGRQQLDPYLTSEVGLALDRVARMNGLSR